MGMLRYFLGNKASCPRRESVCPKGEEVCSLHFEGNMFDGSQVCIHTPMELLSSPDGCWRLVGRLNYLTFTRPDISFVGSAISLSMSMSPPRLTHMEAALRIVRYLKAPLSCGLFYGGHGYLHVEMFTNSDWDEFPLDRRSIIGYCTFLGGILSLEKIRSR